MLAVAKTHPKYVTGRCARCSPNSSRNSHTTSGAQQGKEEGTWISQGGQYLGIDALMFSIAVEELFRVQNRSKSKQCKYHLGMRLGSSEVAQEQQGWIPWLHTPPGPGHPIHSTPAKLLLCHNTFPRSSCWRACLCPATPCPEQQAAFLLPSTPAAILPIPHCALAYWFIY